jgi:uncharacterized cupredoxin-like copper-binding protein
MSRGGAEGMSARTVVTGSSLAVVIAVAFALPDAVMPVDTAAHTVHEFAAGEPGDPKQPFRVVEIMMTDGPGTMSYKPNKIQVRKGEQIKLILKNVGMVDHEFLIDSFANNAKHKKEMEKNPEMEHDEPNGARLKPNTTTEILWRFSKAGTFEFACLIPGHYDTGMKGTFVVN